MGGGTWDTGLYRAAATTRAKLGVDDFAYSKATHAKPTSAWAVDPALDPKLIKGVRESRDSDEHPDSVAIAVTFDVTGSMGRIPAGLQKKLSFLMEFVIGRGGVAHPQILMAAVGDATCDRVPFQIGQFESDNRLDEQLRLIFLEGGGGGQISESYGLSFYAAARKTTTDCWEKRGRKGYWFTIGDEKSWPVKSEHVLEVFGDTIQERELAVKDLIAEASERWHLFHIVPRNASHGEDPDVLDFWRELLGQHVLRIDDMDKICELIAAQIALMEGAEFDDIRAAAGDDVAKALVPATGWNAPKAASSGTVPVPPNRPGSISTF